MTAASDIRRVPAAPLRRRHAVRVLAGCLLGLLAAGGAASQPATTDRDALMALYDAANGPNWARNENWGSDRPLDEWDGVGTDPISGRVDFLYLAVNGLRGPIPAELGTLTGLDYLDLSWNSLTGPIPPELGNLTNLSELALGVNHLTGPMPAELGALVRLRALSLWSNELTGRIPAELGRLTNLQSLSVKRHPELTPRRHRKLTPRRNGVCC